jgi:hypothetical protein
MLEKQQKNSVTAYVTAVTIPFFEKVADFDAWDSGMNETHD